MDITDEYRRGAGDPRTPEDRESPAFRRRVRPVVLFRDEALIVVDKPAGLPLFPHEEEGPSVVGKLLFSETARTAYGIDDDASGIAVLDLGERPGPSFRERLAAGEAGLTYQALVRATLPAPAGMIELAIAPPDPRSLRVRIDRELGRPARTDWRLVDAYAGFALIECDLRSDHRHQVRVHLQACGMPLVVDPLYGGGPLMLSSFKAGYRPSRRHVERPLIGRLSLHLVRVKFPHPRSGERLAFESTPPRDFRAAVAQLSKFGRLGPPVR